MASDPMLDVLRAAITSESMWLADNFIRTHGPALLARLEAMEKAVEKAVAEEREAIAAQIDREAHTAGAQGYNGEPKHTDYHATARRIRARGQS